MDILKRTFYLLAVLFLMDCATPPEYPIEPFIEFISLNKDTMKDGVGFADSILVRFSFTDGDGDFGYAQGNNIPKNIFIINRETGDTLDRYTSPEIPELGASNGIRGEVTLILFQQCCEFDINSGYVCSNPNSTPPTPTDTLLMDIVVLDRAGNESNRIEASPLILICD